MNFRKTITTTIISMTILLGACAAPPQEIKESAAQPGAEKGAGSGSTLAVGHGGDVPGQGAPAPGGMPAGAPAPGPINLKWTTPSKWQTGPDKAMRAATYLIPATAGDSEGGECAVFSNIGGGVAANIDRWIGQFEQPDGSPSASKAKQARETINGMQVTTVDLTGTFAGGGMAMGAPATKKTGYRLLGAIVETPQGEIFFKLTGPAKTVAAAQNDFRSLLKSIK
jgi:hypothetical protein